MAVRDWEKLKYLDPEPLLIGLKEFYDLNPMQMLPSVVSNLRRRDVRHIGEARRCALFCYGVGKALGVKVLFADHESEDYDYVGLYRTGKIFNFVPIQMKEFVPTSVNPTTQLQAELDKLSKYKDSSNLIVAVHVNRTGLLNLSHLHISHLKIKELWFFGAKANSPGIWTIIGNVLNKNAIWHDFGYPEA